MCHRAGGRRSSSTEVTFTVELVGSGARGRVCMIGLPAKVHAALGGDRARIPVTGTADGRPIRTTAAPMGGVHCFVFNRAMQAATGKGPGDTVTFVLARDAAVRTVAVPPDLERALAADPRAQPAFAALAYTHRREYVQWIEEAKRPETRARRIEKAVRMVAEGMREPHG